MRLRRIVVPALLLPLAMLSACAEDEAPTQTDPAVAPAPTDYGDGPTSKPDLSGEGDTGDGIVEGPGDDDPLNPEKPDLSEDPASLIPFEDKPASVSEADLTEQERTWLEDLETLEANPEIKGSGGGFAGGSSFGVDEDFTVNYGETNGSLYIDAVTDEGEGVSLDSGQRGVVRVYAPSAQTQGYLELLVPALEAWHAKHGEWPSADWAFMDDVWVLEPGSMADYEAKPVKLKIPETFEGKGYMLMGDEGAFYFKDADTGEKITLPVEGEKITTPVASGFVPIQ